MKHVNKEKAMEPICCEITCEKPAEYTVIDQGDADPVTSFTESCTDHVGVLLGHATHVRDTNESWRVVPVGP